MEIAVIILSSILYIGMAFIVGLKQFEAMKDDEAEAEVPAFFCGVAWPIVLFIYIVKCVFFRKWR